MGFWLAVVFSISTVIAGAWASEMTGDAFYALCGGYSAIFIGSAYFLLFSKGSRCKVMKNASAEIRRKVT